MIQLSMEIPTHYLEEWNPLCDLDFVLAHRILEDEKYSTYYASRTKGRKLLLDNSMHELGHPLPISDLELAAGKVLADVVIAPDRLGQVQQNRNWFLETTDELGDVFQIGAVMCGRTQIERRAYLEAVQSSDVLLLPYRENRLAWFMENERYIIQNWSWIHLLGVSELVELSTFVMLSKTHDSLTWSVDTGKAIKWGIEEVLLAGRDSLRNNKLHSKDLLSVGKLSKTQEYVIEQNIQTLHNLCMS